MFNCFNIIIRKLLDSFFQQTIGTKMAVSEILLNAENFSSVTLPTQGVT
jgi:hypothetical protein